ncbi:hypothetical protein BC936DRAFT_146949 [Jimgerdemannia flammicorona]|uniref:Uncharacterized protein n=1 Tax=Jimgerdemannia flammicorona TaxID=994334 RepID=A0A433D6H1_9FUNG|nr:hypothetical protein BC936DRAFT_146949 [Jimgerdemannia flammicorona]
MSVEEAENQLWMLTVLSTASRTDSFWQILRASNSRNSGGSSFCQSLGAVRAVSRSSPINCATNRVINADGVQWHADNPMATETCRRGYQPAVVAGRRQLHPHPDLVLATPSEVAANHGRHQSFLLLIFGKVKAGATIAATKTEEVIELTEEAVTVLAKESKLQTQKVVTAKRYSREALRYLRQGQLHQVNSKNEKKSRVRMLTRS